MWQIIHSWSVVAWMTLVGLVLAGGMRRFAAAEADPPKNSEAKVKVTAKAKKLEATGKQTITVTLTVDKGWHIYANPVGNEDLTSVQTTVTVTGKNKPKNVKVTYPEGKIIEDKTLGANYKVYENQVTIQADVERAQGDDGPLDVTIQLQACCHIKNKEQCLLPAVIKRTVR